MRVLGAGLADPPLVDDEHLALGGAVGQRRAQREPDHLLGSALAVVARLRAVRHTTTTPVRRADRALAGAAGALLAPRLRATAADLGPGLRAVRAGAGGRELRGDDLVHHRGVGLDAEQVVGHVDRAGAARRSGTSRRASCCATARRLRHRALGRVLHEHEPAVGAGHRALHEEDAALGVALDHLEVLAW